MNDVSRLDGELGDWTTVSRKRTVGADCWDEHADCPVRLVSFGEQTASQNRLALAADMVRQCTTGDLVLVSRQSERRIWAVGLET